MLWMNKFKVVNLTVVKKKAVCDQNRAHSHTVCHCRENKKLSKCFVFLFFLGGVFFFW